MMKTSSIEIGARSKLAGIKAVRVPHARVAAPKLAPGEVAK